MPRFTPTTPLTWRRTVLSTDVVAELVRLDSRRPGMLARLVASFRESLDECVDGLWKALAQDHEERIRELTHRLSGVSGQLGAAVLADACFALSRADGQVEATQRMLELESLAKRSLAELEQLAARASAS